jgi:hypothetical protein
MPEGSRREREERAADALLVSLLRRVDKDDDYIDPKHLPQLTDEERAAVDALGADFVDRLLAGERPLAAEPDPEHDSNESEVALSGCGPDTSFNRAEVVDDAITEELEEQERKIIERKRREREEGGGDPASGP